MGVSVGDDVVSSAGTQVVSRYRALMRRTRDVLLRTVQGLSPAELAWRPDEGIPAIENHLLHLAREEETLVRRALRDEACPRQRRQEFEEQPPREVGFYLGELERGRALTDDWLAGATDVSLDAALTSGSPLEGACARDLIEYLVRHEVHHRAQVLFLLKLIDPTRSFPSLP